MEDELWMRKIKERLEDYSEPLPVSGWERLEKDMPASKPKRRIIPFRRWAVAAAAVLLAAVSSVSIWLLQSPVGEEMRNTATPTLAVVPDELPGRQAPQMRTEVAEPDYRAQGQTAAPGGTNRRSLLAQELNVAAETDRQTESRQLWMRNRKYKERHRNKRHRWRKRKLGRLPPGIAVRRTGRWSAAVRRAGTNCNCLLATEKRRSRAAGRLDWLWEIRVD